jgi:thiamine-monophosphate kinase
VGARVDLGAIPLSESTRAVARAVGVDPLGWALSGGEDYELLFTAAPDHTADLIRLVTERLGTPVHRIGEMRPAADGVRFLDQDGRTRAVDPGFDHFG